MLAAAFHRDLGIRASEQRIVDARLQPQRRLLRRIRTEALPDIQLLHLPGTQAFLQVLEEPRRIGGDLERNRRQLARQLMLTVAIRRRARSARPAPAAGTSRIARTMSPRMRSSRAR